MTHVVAIPQIETSLRGLPRAGARRVGRLCEGDVSTVWARLAGDEAEAERLRAALAKHVVAAKVSRGAMQGTKRSWVGVGSMQNRCRSTHPADVAADALEASSLFDDALQALVRRAQARDIAPAAHPDPMDCRG